MTASVCRAGRAFVTSVIGTLMNFLFLVSADQTATANKDKEQHGNSSQKDLAVIAGGIARLLICGKRLTAGWYLLICLHSSLIENNSISSSSSCSLLPLPGSCHTDSEAR